MTKKILIGHPHYCAILNQKTVSGSQFYAEYIYNAFALKDETEPQYNKENKTSIDDKNHFSCYTFNLYSLQDYTNKTLDFSDFLL